MLIVMCVGACAGSTGGGFKVSRIVILAKSARRELKRLAHPRSVSVITMDGKRISDEVVTGTNVFFFIYVVVFVVSLLIVSTDGKDMVTNISGVIATLNNIGPGLGEVGPTGNFSDFSWYSKVVFILDMLLGRLEIFPFLMLFTPKLKRSKIIK